MAITRTFENQGNQTCYQGGEVCYMCGDVSDAFYATRNVLGLCKACAIKASSIIVDALAGSVSEKEMAGMTDKVLYEKIINKLRHQMMNSCKMAIKNMNTFYTERAELRIKNDKQDCIREAEQAGVEI